MVESFDWLIYAFFTILLYGLWGFFSKLATNHISYTSIMVYQIVGSLAVSLAILLGIKFKVEVNFWGIFYAFLVGLVGTIATLCFVIALNKGQASIVVTVTSLYPVVSILLAFFILKEPLNYRQLIGILLAIIAMILCAV